MNTSPKQGFTLLELLLSAAILVSSISVILTTYVGGLALNDASRNLSKAVSHAQFILEDIRNSTFSTLSSDIASGTWNWNAATVASKGLSALNSETTTVTSSGSNPLDITVTINWQDLNHRARSRTIKTGVSG